MLVRVAKHKTGPINFGGGQVVQPGQVGDISAARAQVLIELGEVERVHSKCGHSKSKHLPKNKTLKKPKPEVPMDIVPGMCRCCGMLPKKVGNRWLCPKDGKKHYRGKDCWREPCEL